MIEKLAKVIFGKKQKKVQSTEESKYIVDEDFIPYVSHFDNHTLITKNGELLQIIRITGFGEDGEDVDNASLREKVRESISQKISQTNVAFWFSTLRRKKDITPPANFKEGFSKDFNQEWAKLQNFKDNFVNELYISIIIEGLDTSISNFSGAVKSLSFGATKKLHKSHLQESLKELNKISDEFLADIKHFGAKKLGITEWDGILYSEPMRLFGKIINLYEERYPLLMNDISTDLASHMIAFGDREIEVVGHNNKNYATLFTLKEYSEISDSNLDHILQLPFEFIVTQSFDYSTDEKDLESYKYNDYILRVSGDQEYRDLSGLETMLNNDEKIEEHDYVKMQTSLMLIAPSKEDLEKDIAETLEHMHDLGLLFVREDVFMEHCFWAQLPANFTFLRRQKILETELVGGFAMLHSYPSGSMAGNHWGSSITTLKTVIDTPYYFNFHKYNSGHTIIMGSNNSGKTVLTNFLISQAQRIEPRVVIVDASGKSESFVKCLDGTCHKVDLEDAKNSCNINPISSNHKDALADFIKSLIDKDNILDVKKEIKDIAQISDVIIKEKITDFATMIKKFDNDKTPNTYKNIKKWILDADLKDIFSQKDDLNFNNKITSIDISQYFDNQKAFAAMICCLINKIENLLDDKPFILVLDDVYRALENDFLALKFERFLKLAEEKNCVVIIKSNNVDDILKCKRYEAITQRLTNFIYFGDENVDSKYVKIFDLSEEELNIINLIGQNRQSNFLFKQEDDSIIFNFDLSAINAYLDILSNSELTLSVLDKLIEDELYGKDKDKTNIKISSLLPKFIEQLNDIEKQRIVEIENEEKAEKKRQRKILEEKLNNE